MQLWLVGVGIVGPGLAGWDASRAVLSGAAAHGGGPILYPPIAGLPAAERRRLGIPVKLALSAALEAFAHAGVDPRDIATVFSSSGGDGENVHRLCQTLASVDREVSPTRFHNAVHNAAAGYWSITTGAQAASTSLCCHDASVAAGLLEAAAQAASTARPVALIAYDHRYPEPLHSVRPIADDLGIAMVFLPAAADCALARLEIAIEHGHRAVTTMASGDLERLRAGVPAGRALPLLAAVASGRDATVILDYLEPIQLRVEIIPASSDRAFTRATAAGT